MQAPALLVGRVLGCAVAGLSLGVAVGLVPAAGARSARVAALHRISAVSPLPASCVVPGTPIRDSELEPALAVDPRRPRRLVAAWMQDLVNVEGALSHVTASSSDGGRHWRTRLVPGVSQSCPRGRSTAPGYAARRRYPGSGAPDQPLARRRPELVPAGLRRPPRRSIGLRRQRGRHGEPLSPRSGLPRLGPKQAGPDADWCGARARSLLRPHREQRPQLE